MNRRLRVAWITALGIVLAAGGLLLLAPPTTFPGYLGQAGAGQFRLMLARVPVAEVLARPDTAPQVREKLRLIGDVQRYAVEHLGYAPTDNYTDFVAVDRPAVSWTLSAAPPTALVPKTWSFPIVGAVPYLGFFARDDALTHERELIADGYETYLRPVPAFSTLGWFDDPVYSPMLNYDTVSLVNLIMHEEAHATVFIEGHVEFNETMATVMGHAAARRYLDARYGADSAEFRRAEEEYADSILFSRFIESILDDLEELYAQQLGITATLHVRERVFAKARERYAALPFRRDDYDGFVQREWNNAVLLSRGRYYTDVPLYERILAQHENDFARTWEFYRTIEESGKNPREACLAWLNANDQAESFDPSSR